VGISNEYTVSVVVTADVMRVSITWMLPGVCLFFSSYYQYRLP